MFESNTLKLLQAENAALRGQVSDLHSQLMTERRHAADQVKALVDRIIAMSNPVATAAVARAEGKEPAPVPMKASATTANPVRGNWPQGIPNTRPNVSPRVKESMMANAASIEQASDLARGVQADA